MAGAKHIIAAGRGGSITLVSSAAGLTVEPFMIAYTASKHAVTALARSFAAELGKHHIRVNSLHPGSVATPMGSGRMIEAMAEAAQSNPALRPGFTKQLMPDGSPRPRTSPVRSRGWHLTRRDLSRPPPFRWTSA